MSLPENQMSVNVDNSSNFKDGDKVAWEESLLTNAFNDQLRLVEKSFGGEANKKDISDETVLSKRQQKKQKRKPGVTVQEYTNKSRKFRFEADGESLEGKSSPVFQPIIKKEDFKENGSPLKGNLISADADCIIPPPFARTGFPLIEDLDQAHASMLMSWYMAGYHTGYCEAMKKFKK